jgi:hypothetical protein
MDGYAERLGCENHRGMAARVARRDTARALQSLDGVALPQPALLIPEAVMLHSLQPAQFGSQHLRTPCKCPECDQGFVYEDGVVFLAHYVAGSGRVGQGLMCFCSTRCLLLWEHPSTMGLMQ